MKITIFVAIGIITGIIFGFIGDAATAAVVPLLLFFNAVPSIKHAIGTSMGMLLWPVGITGAYQYYKDGYINPKGSLIMAMTFMAAAYVSSRYVKKIPEEYVKDGVSAFLILLGIGTYFCCRKTTKAELK